MSAFDSLTDEEFLNQTSPSTITAEETVEEKEKEEEVPSSEETAQETSTNLEDLSKVAEDTSATPETKEVETEISFPEDFNYREAYLQLTKPFKANGKTVVVKDAAEIISLMQKGIGYTAKSQKLQDKLRVAETLEAAGISKEDLNLLIEANRKNPKALQKLIKNSNIDPLDLDLSEESGEYVPNNYEVSDEEVQFKAALEEISSSTGGQELIANVKGWDAVSKDLVWKQPTLLNVLTEQVENGVYKTISDEVSRRRLVGTIPENTPFLHAYHEVGRQLLEQSSKAKSKDSSVAKVTSGSNKVLVDRRVTTPKPTIANSDKVSAASVHTKKPTQGVLNADVLKLSDSEFMKLTAPR